MSIPFSRKARAQFSSPAIDRLPPHSSEAEQGVLGSILCDPATALNEARAQIKSSEIFYDLRHQTIYDALCSLSDKGTNIDVITLQQFLKDSQKLEEVGGIGYLAALPDVTSSSANIQYYLDIVLEKYVLRRLIFVCTDAVAKVYDHEGDLPSLLDSVESDILSIRGNEIKSLSTSKQLVPDAIKRIEEFHQAQGRTLWTPSGFSELDHFMSGLPPGEMIVISAFPSGGKTALAGNILENVAIDSKLPVGLFSLEMAGLQIILRMLSSRARVNLKNIRDGFLAERDFPKLTAAALSVKNANIYIDDSCDLSIYQLRAKARRMVQQFGVKLFVIDYVQLLTATGGTRKINSRQEEVAEISSGIKKMSRELQVPVIALSQLNDDGQLRESRAIGQDGDTVIRLKKDDDQNPNDDTIRVTAEILKQRNGPTGNVNLLFLKSFTRFENASRIADQDIPNTEHYPK